MLQLHLGVELSVEGVKLGIIRNVLDRDNQPPEARYLCHGHQNGQLFIAQRYLQQQVVFLEYFQFNFQALVMASSISNFSSSDGCLDIMWFYEEIPVLALILLCNLIK